MKAPRIAEHVRVRGYDRLFYVTKVDEERQVVSLIPVTGLRPILDEVSFSELVVGPFAVRDSSEP